MKTTFTRADLVVTLLCIVFLLATIGAVGPGGQRHAKEMLCLSQLHKWGEVFQDYLNDNDGYFMKGYVHEAPSGIWMEALRTYYKKPQMRVCPEATIPGTEVGVSYVGRTFTAWGIFGEGWFATPGDYGSYGMNSWAYNPPVDAPTQFPSYLNWRTANVVGGDNIPLFLDSLWVERYPLHLDEPPPFPDYYESWDNGMQIFAINRHRGYVNSLFLDGSSRKVGLKELWTLKWHRQYDTCGPWTVCGGITPNDWPIWMQDFEDY